MNLSKVEYAKKLIKFGKKVEAAEILKKFISENSDFSLRKNALEVLLFEIELKNDNLVWERIDPLIDFAEEQSVFSKEKIDEIRSLKNTKIVNLKNEIISTDKFEEIYSFFKNNFLSSNFNKNPREIFYEIDFELAVKTAHDQNVKNSYESWSDIRKFIEKEIYNFIFLNSINIDYLDDEINKLNIVLENKLNNQDKVFYYFLDDVESDIYLILMTYYVDFENTLIDLLLEAYKCNYFPCGWKGDFPSGNLCVTNGMLEYEIK